jgi:prepilin-type N-terminal cleavage/methylation domain-containing protein
MKRFPILRPHSGFTLIELLIAIAVSGIVLAGLVQVFTTSNRSYSLQDEMATQQQNLRVAKTYLERDIRMAGCGFGSAFFYLGTQIYPLENTNAVSGSPSDPPSGPIAGSDILTISYVNYSDLSSGSLPQLTPTSLAPSPSPTTFTVSTNSDVSLWESGPHELPFLAVYTRPVSFGSTNLISDVFTVTGVDSANRTLTCTGLRTDISTTNISQSSSINFFSAAQLNTIRFELRFEVTPIDPLNPKPMLYRTDNDGIIREIAENIEDLQFAFGLDSNSDGIVENNEWFGDGIIDGGDEQDLDDNQKTQIRLVRISILGKSSRQLPGQKEIVRPDIEDHAVGTVTPEKYLRQLIQFEIKPRNLKG